MTKNFRCINTQWEDLFNIKLNDIPRQGEMIFQEGNYYVVINLIHTHNKNIILIIDTYES